MGRPCTSVANHHPTALRPPSIMGAIMQPSRTSKQEIVFNGFDFIDDKITQPELILLMRYFSDQIQELIQEPSSKKEKTA